ncbi:hypothetical protein SEA_MILANI_6 [Microbacterium phage Milani]|nr:hypothetical protein SEA_MILANI_6 [Microbacterium phage Milani]
MPVSPTPDEAYYWEVAQAYQRAELEILSQIRDRLDRGQTLSDVDWATSRLAEVQQMRQSATRTLAGVNRSMASRINGAFGNAYKDGGVAALKDASRYLPEKPSAVSSEVRQATVRALADRTREGLAGVMPNLLRKMEDDYREVVRSVVASGQAGGADRRRATTKALQAAYGKGLKTGPDGRMNLPDYVQMAVRTGTANAAIQGHLDTLSANGLDLVYIQPGPRHCDRCDQWANVPLWRASGSAGQVTVESVVSDRPVRVDVKGSLDQAKAAGWGHPNCRCAVGAYLPGVTEKTLPRPRPAWDQDGYENQQKQREIERHIREWKTREALSADPAERARAAAKVAQWQEIQRAHVKAHPELKRQYRREQPSTVQPPNASPKPPKAPRSPSDAPAGTRTAPEDPRVSPDLSDAAKIRNAEVMYGTGSKQHLEAQRRFGSATSGPKPVKVARYDDPRDAKLAVKAGDWRAVEDRAQRAQVLLQNDYRTEKVVKGIAENIKAGRDPYFGVIIDQKYQRTLLGNPASSRTTFTEADFRSVMEDAGRWLADQETTRVPTLYKGLDVNRASMESTFKVGGEFEVNYSSFTSSKDTAYKYTGRVNRVVVRVKGAEAVPLRDADNPTSFSAHKEHLVTGTGRVVKVTTEGGVTWVDVEL